MPAFWKDGQELQIGDEVQLPAVNEIGVLLEYDSRGAWFMLACGEEIKVTLESIGATIKGDQDAT